MREHQSRINLDISDEIDDNEEAKDFSIRVSPSIIKIKSKARQNDLVRESTQSELKVRKKKNSSSKTNNEN